MSDKGVLAIWNDCVTGRESEFESWFQNEHLLERLSIPGFLFGRRHEAHTGSPRYFTFYVAESPQVLTSAPYRERLNNPTPQTQVVMAELFENMNRTVCRRAARVGPFRGSMAITLRFGEAPVQTDPADYMRRYAGHSAVACAEFWQAVDVSKFPQTSEEKLRGGDRRIKACLLIDLLRESDTEAIVADLAHDFVDAEIGIYRVLCQIGRGDL